MDEEAFFVVDSGVGHDVAPVENQGGDMMYELIGIPITAGVTFGLERLIRWGRLKHDLSHVSCVFPISVRDRSLAVKCSVRDELGGKDPKTMRAYVHSAEVLALKEVTSKLEPLGVKLDLGSFYGPPTGTGNLLLIGSDAHNDYSKGILDNLGLYSRVSGQGEHFFFKKGGKEYRCEHGVRPDGKARVEVDYGIIARRRIADVEVLLLAGIHMHGTLAATLVALSYGFQKVVKHERYSSFAQLVKVRTEMNTGLHIDPTTIVWTEFPLVELKSNG